MPYVDNRYENLAARIRHIKSEMKVTEGLHHIGGGILEVPDPGQGDAGSYEALCPNCFNKKAWVSLNGERFGCDSCRLRGDVIDVVMRTKGFKETIEAVEFLEQFVPPM